MAVTGHGSTAVANRAPRPLVGGRILWPVEGWCSLTPMNAGYDERAADDPRRRMLGFCFEHLQVQAT